MIVHIADENDERYVDTSDAVELAKAMQFKADHIKAKAPPELFEAVAKAMRSMKDERHGHWIFYRKGLSCKCSKCRYTLKMSDEYRIAYVVMDERYCYHCGARMDEPMEVIDDEK